MKEIKLSKLIYIVKEYNNEVAKMEIAKRLWQMGGYDDTDIIKDWIINTFKIKVIETTEKEYNKIIKWSEEIYDYIMEIELYMDYIEEEN